MAIKESLPRKLNVVSLPDVACVVVHHKNFPTVLETIDLLRAEGIEPARIVLVDNSEDLALETQIRESLDARIVVRFVPNLGYAQAVNFGVRTLIECSVDSPFVLIATHEVRPQAEAVARLRDFIGSDERVAVAGPMLTHISDESLQIWSRGGYLTRWLGIPRHCKGSRGSPSMPSERQWLDGAFCLYRLDVLEAQQLREDFFLYFEEVEYHVRLRSLGWKVGYVPSAVVSQSSLGTPAFYLGRNMQIYQRLWGTQAGRLFASPTVLIREVGRVVLRRSTSFDIKGFLKGWVAGNQHDIGAVNLEK